MMGYLHDDLDWVYDITESFDNDDFYTEETIEELGETDFEEVSEYADDIISVKGKMTNSFFKRFSANDDLCRRV